MQNNLKQVSTNAMFLFVALHCYAKSFAYINNMPWGYVNYEYKGPRWAPPLARYSRPPFGLDLATRPPTQRGIRVFLECILRTLRLVWACPKPERFPIPYLHFMNNNTQAEDYTKLPHSPNHLSFQHSCW